MSFKGEACISMLATNTVKEGEDGSHINIINTPNQKDKYLRVAAIYGANGSGKSNLFKAIKVFKTMVIGSYKDDKLLVKYTKSKFRFAFDELSKEEPTDFEVTMICNGTQYRYGFEIVKDCFSSEWLFMKKENATKESYCFIRENGNFKTNPSIMKGIKSSKEQTRDNALFLTKLALDDNELAKEVKQGIEDINIIEGNSENTLPYTLINAYKNSEFKKTLMGFVAKLGLGFSDIKYENLDRDDPKHLRIESVHNVYKEGVITRTESMPIESESLGTLKTLAFLGPWIDTLKKGKLLVIDEFGASLHTQMAIELIKLFYSQLNCGEAQLIIATHDTNILRKDFFRRDQVWFVEKNENAESQLYSLVEFKVRNDATFNKDYLAGKYGAIPIFGDIQQLIEDFKLKEEV